MNSITFKSMSNATRNSYDDWGLLLKPRTIPKPSPKTNYVNIPGGNGTLDLSEVVSGEITYNDLSSSFEFWLVDDIDTWDEKISLITNFLHGRKMKITILSDPDYYYLGRCEIDKFTSSKSMGSIVVKYTVEPYKYKQDITVVTADLSSESTKTLYITNDRMTVCPQIDCTETTTIEFEDNTYSLSAGTHTILDIQFKEGMNTVTVTSTGTVYFTFQEGSL